MLQIDKDKNHIDSTSLKPLLHSEIQILLVSWQAHCSKLDI